MSGSSQCKLTMNTDKVTVKQEKIEGANTPWEVKQEPGSAIKQEKPWKETKIPIKKEKKPVKSSLKDKFGPTERVRRVSKLPKTEEQRAAQLICSRNYAAVESERKDFGLIPLELDAGSGIRSLVIHATRGVTASEAFQNVRQGGTIRVVKGRTRISRKKPNDKHRYPSELRVRFITPTRYVPPGSKISCLTIGVDDSEWQSLMTNSRRPLD